LILSPNTPESEDLNNQNFLDLYQLSMDLYGHFKNFFYQI